MKCTAVLLMIVASRCLASLPPPYYVQCVLVDRVAVAAKEGLPGRLIALEILERIAEGRMETASSDLESRVGLEAGQLHNPDFRTEEVRSYALRRIGELDLPEALTYLQTLKKSSIAPDRSGQMSSAADVGLRQAQLNRIPGERDKIRFLEDTTSDRNAAGWWAVDTLCNRGSQQSLPFIREHIRKAYSLARDVEHSEAFCEARMAIIWRDPDRTKALSLFLSVNNGVTDHELIGWAINELHDIDSQEADSAVQRYAREIDGLPEGSPLKAALWVERVQIRNLLPHRPK